MKFIIIINYNIENQYLNY